MSASVAISSAALVSANMAAVNAAAARRAVCEAYLNSYQAATATVHQAQEYASCINLLYPTSSSIPLNPILFKVFIVTMIVSFFWGIIYGFDKDGGFGASMFAFIFPGLTFGSWFAGWLIYSGVIYIFS